MAGEIKVRRRERRTIGPQNVRKTRDLVLSNNRPCDDGLIASYKTYMKSLDSSSNQRPEDTQETFENGGATFGRGIIEPPYNLYALSKLPNNNSILRQCIDVMVTNIESNGYRLEYVGPKGKEDSVEAKAEKNNLINFLDNPNGDYSLIELRERVRYDYEVFGNAFVEVIRDKLGKIKSLYHIPAYTMRLTAMNPEAVEATTMVLGADGQFYEKKYRKRFRRFAQYMNGTYVYFKEFGDPRLLSPRTGEFGNVPFASSATEIFHFAEYTPGTGYGLPRWFNQLPAIMGSREAELTNLDYFQENAIPAMAIMVAGGYLTDETMTAIETAFTNMRGRSAQNRVVVIEAAGDVDAADEHGRIPAPKVELKPLHEERQGDALFQNYEKNCSDKIRSSFRLPPLFLGMSQDYNRATADQSMILGESQIFGPERRKMDDFINGKILSNYKPKYWKFKSLPPRIAGATDLMNTVQTLSDIGALTPNAAINITNETLDMNLKPIPEEWGDRPFFLTQAQAQNGMFGDIGIGENIKPPVQGPAAGKQPTPVKKRRRRDQLTN